MAEVSNNNIDLCKSKDFDSYEYLFSNSTAVDVSSSGLVWTESCRST